VSSVAFVGACAAAMPRGSERARPPTTTVFRNCCAALGCGRACRGGGAAAGAGGSPPPAGRAQGSERAERTRSGGLAGGQCRAAERSLRQFKRSIDLLNEVGGGG
jgi:hypothetical protein